MATQQEGAPVGETDLYVLLNVTRDAAPEQLRVAFRRLSQLYHPDKHVDPGTKEAATIRFTQIKEAYEILGDVKLRRIYDEFGLDPAREAASPAMELTSYNDLAARFRQEGTGKHGSGPSGARDAYFTVINTLDARVDGTGIAVALEDGALHGSHPLAAVTQVSFSSTATAYVAQETTLIAQFAATASHARAAGPGELTLALRQTLAPHSSAEGLAYISLAEPAAPRFSFKAARRLSEFMELAVESDYDPLSSEATTSLTASRAFTERHSASVSWSTGSVPGVAFQWRRDGYDEYLSDAAPPAADAETGSDSEDGNERASPRMRELLELAGYLVAPMGWRWSVRMGPVPSVKFAIHRPVGAHAPLLLPCSPAGPGGACVRLRVSAGPFGWDVEAGASELFVASNTSWGMAVSCGSRGVLWKLRVARGGHRLTLPVVLVSTAGDARAATAAAITSSLVVAAVQALIVQPILRARNTERRAEARERRKDELNDAEKAARAARDLLTRQLETSRAAERGVVVDGREGCGLLVERAVYGVRETVMAARLGTGSFEGRELDAEVIECGDCVQALVVESQVHVVSNTKSTLMGFWDPSALGEKEELVLRIWYWFRGDRHECIVDDMDPLELPLSNHRVAKWV